jgi:hypothetical protein
MRPDGRGIIHYPDAGKMVLSAGDLQVIQPYSQAMSAHAYRFGAGFAFFGAGQQPSFTPVSS